MRHILTLLLAVHAAIHIFGFFEWSKLCEVPQLSGRTWLPLSASGAQLYAGLWLLVLLDLLVAAVLHALRHQGWAPLALLGALASQALIMFAWQDAKFGTLANLLIIGPALAGVAHSAFERTVAREVHALLAAAPREATAPVQLDDLRALPSPVQRWLVHAGVVGRPRTRTVRLKQRGELRTSPNASYMPALAEQYFTLDDPAFSWRVDATMLGFLPFAGRDRYAAGHGHMLIKAASLLNVVDAEDERIAQGALLRLLAEMIWFPSAALSPLIEWRAIDATSAEATLRHGGLIATAVFSFDDQARVTDMRAERYLGGGPEAKLTPWLASCTAWNRVEGIEVPSRGAVSWELESGLFTYYRWELLDLQYDRFALYGED